MLASFPQDCLHATGWDDVARSFGTPRVHCPKGAGGQEAKASLAIVTYVGGNVPAWYGDLLWQNRVAYCGTRRQYAYLQYSGWLLFHNMTDESAAPAATAWCRRMMWLTVPGTKLQMDFLAKYSKMLALRHALTRQRCADAAFEWAFWLDADAIFASSASLTPYTAMPNVHLVFSTMQPSRGPCSEWDPAGMRYLEGDASPGHGWHCGINSGAFFIRRSQTGSQWVEAMLGEPYGVKSRTAARALPTHAMYLADQMAICSWNRQSHHTAHRTAAFVSRSSINSGLTFWREDEPVLHLPGIDSVTHKYKLLRAFVAACSLDEAPIPQALLRARGKGCDDALTTASRGYAEVAAALA